MHRIIAFAALVLALAAAVGAASQAPTATRTELARELPGGSDDGAET